MPDESGDRPPKSKALTTLPTIQESSLGNQAVVEAAQGPRRPVLVVISGQDMGQRQPVDRTLLIGRDLSCDFVLTDALVSGRHALLEDRGDSWTVVDLQSTNGISVNGAKGTDLVLSPGGKLLLGNTILRFDLQDPLEQAYDEQVARLLTIDDLSGLLVRRKFDADLEAALVAANATSSRIGFLMMDMDGIKSINDTHGHLFGAFVIGEAGHIIGRAIEGRGFASRFGGDEFMAALPGADLAEAHNLAQQIQRAVSDHHFLRETISLRASISIGIAAYPETAPDGVQLLQRADEALYRAKRSGKNCVSR